MDNEKRRRGSMAVLVIPLMVVFAAVSRVGDKVRTVDFLRIFGAGMLFGVALTWLLRSIFDKKKTEA